MVGEWMETTIGALCKSGLAALQTGPFGSQLHTHDYMANGVPVVPTEAIRGRRIDYSMLPKISRLKAEELVRHCLKPGDILFARRGVQATGHIGFVRDAEAGMICGTGAIRFRVKHANGDLDAEFLSHVLANPASIAWFKFHAIGATMPNLNEGIIRAFPFVLPPPRGQRSIASLLSALDDKIELNRQTNATLEAMARALFKDWFVDFGPTRAKAEGRAPYLAPHLWDLFPDALDDEDKPVGWEFGCLSRIAESPSRGISPSEVSDDKPYIGLKHMPRRSIALTEWEGAGKVTSNKSSFKKGEFLFGKLRPYFHKVGVTPTDGICSTDIVVVKSRSIAWSAFVLACISSDEFVAFTDQTSTGTKMPRTSWHIMGQYDLCLPPEPLATAFQDEVQPMINRLVASIHESRTLAQTRDLLLPKLMSGELRLREAERIAGEAL
jgi:type I restriction enzyme S subunit